YFGRVAGIEVEVRVERAERDAEFHVVYEPSDWRCQPPAAPFPPSTWIVVPVTNPHSSGVARDTIAAATSSGSPAGGGGGRTSSSPPIPGVGITSGATQLTRIRRGPSSRARLCVRLTWAAFIAL